MVRYLKDLDVSSNLLDGAVPSFAAATRLSTLHLSYNQHLLLTHASALPSSLAQLHARALFSAVTWHFPSVCDLSFKVIELSGTPLQADLPPCLTRMTQLQQVQCCSLPNLIL